ncbi:MAG: leucine--tRNA ligase [Candidatus Nitrosocaldaceae archaeon]|nr:MAG: leucine--tRNA ligase [Candidatus Nitrosocaldaceae archaeon]
MIDYNKLQDKWIRIWNEQRLFESDPDNDNKYFITVAYPYPNSPQHIGHGRTYTLADIHARYMRMKGYNVLFPMGFHYTGTPILAMAKRVADNDQELINAFINIYKVPRDEIEKFRDPLEIARYFHKEIKQGMIEMGYSIDWRREFTTIDKLYSRFIEWQFRKLREKGYVVQGSHPVGWCPRDNNPVSQHDTLGDVEPEFNEYTLIKFEYDGIKIPTATLRPETIFGVTNLWINPDADYVKAHVDDEEWIISERSAYKLTFLNRDVKIIEKFKGKELLYKEVKIPIEDRKVKILPAKFVDPNNGSGIVMSVPAHAPYDYQALIDLGIKFEPIVIIESEKYKGKIPAYEVIKEFKIKGQDDPKLEDATNELYSTEYYNGIMLDNTDIYSKMKVSEARDKVKQDLINSNKADTMLELVEPVRCRCGAECVVKILDDQWFIDYSNREWKDLAHECLRSMNLMPEDIRREFEYTIEWLKERACARRSGLGTKLPWDKDWIIESLSDSVIYMAYYTIAKYADKIDADKIDDQFFDYVFYGIGDTKSLADKYNLSEELIGKIRDEFEYYYPVDSRHSGRDLIPNHLTFFIFNHVAIFDRSKWPREIVVNGSVLMEGKKMSKSMGNIIPLREAIREHGADAIRASIMISAELLQDADFTFDTLEGIKNRLEKIYNTCKDIEDASSNDKVDRWLNSILQHKIRDITNAMDRLRVREALHEIIYGMDDILQWYQKRKVNKKLSLKRFFNVRVRLLAPFAPFITEEIWHMFGNKDSIMKAEWPKVDESKIDYEADEGEALIMNLLDDINNILKVTKMKPNTIYIYTASKEKHELYSRILYLILNGKRNFRDIMKELVNSDQAEYAKKMPEMIRKMVDDILSVSEEARIRRNSIMLDEKSYIEDAKELLAREFNAIIKIYNEDNAIDPKSKAKHARPYKPALYIE